MKIKYLLISTGLALVSFQGHAEELSTTGDMLDGIAAIVNEGVVLKSELSRNTALIIERAKGQDLPLPPPSVLREQVLERLIMEELQMQRAQRVGLQISDQMLNDAIAGIVTQNGVAFDDLPELLASQVVDYGEYRRDMRRQMTFEQLRRIEVTGRISVAPREIEQCLAELDDNVVVNSEYNLSHILVSIAESATGEDIAAAEQEVTEVWQQIEDGADFGEMAVRHSDSQTSLEGGNLGWMEGNQLPTMFSDVVGELAAGETSAPIRTVSGFHLVKVNELRSANKRSEIEQVHVRHILITPNEIIDDQTAKQRLTEAVTQIRNGDDEFEELAKLMSDDPGSGNNGGDMGWTGPDTFVPEFEEVVAKSEIGVVSEPFRSRFGWHIVEVLGRRTYDNTDDLKEQNCVARIRNDKLANETELWMRRIRDEAYVETRI
jgi:peptidyl-prolyl cis-trans isomerase SurA